MREASPPVMPATSAHPTTSAGRISHGKSKARARPTPRGRPCFLGSRGLRFTARVGTNGCLQGSSVRGVFRSVKLSLHVHTPCRASWESMEPDGAHRGCARCGKVVHDL